MSMALVMKPSYYYYYYFILLLCSDLQHLRRFLWENPRKQILTSAKNKFRFRVHEDLHSLGRFLKTLFRQKRWVNQEYVEYSTQLRFDRLGLVVVVLLKPAQQFEPLVKLE